MQKVRAYDTRSGGSVLWPETVEQAVDLYRRERCVKQTTAAYIALRSDPKGWQELKAEHDPWDETLIDGLDLE